MEKNRLTPEEGFKIINKAIANFKINFKEGAQVFLLWGWILILASVSHFIILTILNNMEAQELTYGSWELKGLLSLANWVVYCLLGFILMYFMNRKLHKNKKIYSYLDGYINNLWKVTVFAFFLAALICVKLGITPPPVMLLIAGIATTTTGLLIKFRPVIIGGMSFFIFSIASTFVSNEYLALIVSVAIMCGYLIPGYFLKSAKE